MDGGNYEKTTGSVRSNSKWWEVCGGEQAEGEGLGSRWKGSQVLQNHNIYNYVRPARGGGWQREKGCGQRRACWKIHAGQDLGGCPYCVKVTPSFFGSQVSGAQPTSEDGNIFPILPIFYILNSGYPFRPIAGALGSVSSAGQTQKIPQASLLPSRLLGVWVVDGLLQFGVCTVCTFGMAAPCQGPCDPMAGRGRAESR